MSDIVKKKANGAHRAARWDRFWDDVWVYGGAVSLLVLVSLSTITL